MKKTFAFWKCDQYPYFLGGEVDVCRIHPYNTESVYIKSYQRYFRYILMCYGDEGVELMEKLKHLQTTYREALFDVNREFNELLSEVAPEIADKI